MKSKNDLPQTFPHFTSAHQHLRSVMYKLKIMAVLILDWIKIAERFLWLDNVAPGAISPALKTWSLSCSPNLNLSHLEILVQFYCQRTSFNMDAGCVPQEWRQMNWPCIAETHEVMSIQLSAAWVETNRSFS